MNGQGWCMSGVMAIPPWVQIKLSDGSESDWASHDALEMHMCMKHRPAWGRTHEAATHTHTVLCQTPCTTSVLLLY